jgi:hypothetical protein
MLTRRLFATFAVLLAADYASAQQPAPQLLGVFPMGAKAGDTVEVTFAGHNLDGAEKLLFSAKGFKADPVGTATGTKGQQGQPTSTMKFKVSVPKDAAGTLDVRVVGKNGISNPRAFVVGNLTDVSETEPNNDVGQAQSVALDTTVNGVISAPTDVDFVTFKAKAGQNIVVYCLATSIDSKLHADIMVSGPDGKPLASNHAYRDGDAVLDFKAPTDGDYHVRVSQFAYTTGGFDHFYRLTVTTKPWVDAVWPPVTKSPHTTIGRNLGGPAYPVTGSDGRLLSTGNLSLFVSPDPIGSRLLDTGLVNPPAAGIDAVGTGTSRSLLLLGNTPGVLVLDNEKNNTPEAAQAVQVPCDVAGRILKKNDRHWYSFTAKKGDVWTLEVFADRIGSPVDAFFILTDEKGKVITEQDDGADTLSPNQFYSKTDDPGRYKFTAPNDGNYRVMVSTREAGTQFGPRDQFVLRIAKEKPDFRVAVMGLTPHVPEAGSLPKGAALAFAVFVFRFDGFNDAIELTASNLPKGVKCPKQVIGVGQTRGTLVLVADKDAEDWDGFVQIQATAGDLKHAARPFTVTWPAVGVQQNQVPNTPMITRMDRGGGLAIAVRGEAPFTLTPTQTALTAKAGGKLDVTLKVTRDSKFKDGITVVAATPGFGPRPQGNNPYPPVGTAAANANEVKVSVDVPNNLPPGTHTLVLRGISAAPAPKGGNNTPLRVQPTYAAVPITVKIEGDSKKK